MAYYYQPSKGDKVVTDRYRRIISGRGFQGELRAGVAPFSPLSCTERMLYSNRNRPLTVRCFRGVIAGSADVCNHARNVITAISLENPLPEKEEETCDRWGVFEKITRWNLCQNSYLNF